MRGPALLLGLLLAAGQPERDGCRDDGRLAGRETVLARLNAARSARGSGVLRLEPRLCRAAGRRALAIASEEEDRSDEEMMIARIEDFGYEPRAVFEVLAESDEGADGLLARLARSNGALHDKLVAEPYRDLGVGFAEVDGLELTVLLLGVSQEEFFRTQTEPLADSSRVRREMLARVNAERAEAKRASLRAGARLDGIAQAYAQDMLARSFYGHVSPEGKDVGHRTRAAGYASSVVAENLARGQFSVEEVMDGWMASELHRKNLLSAMFTEIGTGLACGHNREGRVVIWVQVFGRPR